MKTLRWLGLLIGMGAGVLVGITPSIAQDLRHGLALHGTLKYHVDFKNFDYVNPQAPKGGTLRLAALGSFDNLNPYILKGVPATGLGLVFETLMESALDEPFSQYGRLAESVEVAKDRSWVSYVLRPEARFHDGSPVTPEDVLFSFETLRDKGHPSYKSYYKDVQKAEKTGPHSVKFTFRTNKNTELPLIMGQLPVFSKQDWKNKDFAATTLTPIVGSGPYKIETVTAGRDITYKKVANWWGENLPVNKGQYNFDTIRYDYYRDSTVATEAFFAGRYDVRLENIAKNWATLYTTPAVQKGEIQRREIKNQLPSGMQGFVFNLRRPLFQDSRVREALGYAFDFEWTNKTVAYGSYQRTKSYFMNADLASSGLPSPQELALLEPFRGRVPDDVFTKAYEPPASDGSGNLRDNLAKAAALLKDAGWRLEKGQLVDAKGAPFTFEILESSPLFERWVQPFLRNLERLGIKAQLRAVDTAQYQNRLNSFDFDMVIHVFGQSLSPGNEQRDMWSSAKADQLGSRNLIGIKNEAVDALVEKVVAAPDRESLVTATRALDRVLLWNHYVIPHWYSGVFRIAYWNKLGVPDVNPAYDIPYVTTWWQK